MTLGHLEKEMGREALSRPAKEKKKKGVTPNQVSRVQNLTPTCLFLCPFSVLTPDCLLSMPPSALGLVTCSVVS